MAGHLPATTVDPPLPPEVLGDRLSDLPEPLLATILSLLPTHLAAQASCLSRRFRHLWSASPSLHFDRSSFSYTTRFVNMVDHALLGRDCSVPLESLCIQSSPNSPCHIPFTSIVCWIDHTARLGVGHLHLRLETSTAAHLCPNIFSIKSLESLHMRTLTCRSQNALIPLNIVSTRLKSLNLWLNVKSADLTRLISGLPVLEYLELRGIDQDTIDISSLSVRTLKLDCESSKMMKLCFPMLDCIHLFCEVYNLQMFQGGMPLLSKAKFHVRSLLDVPVLVLRSMLKSIANAIELKLTILTSMQSMRTYRKCRDKQLCFPRLESLHISCNMCYLELFQWEMPQLRNADINLSYAKEEFVPPLSSFLKHFANVVDLKLTIVDDQTYLRCCEMQLSFSRLEYLKFSGSMCYLELFQWEMPQLRNADINLSYAKEEFVPPLSSFLKHFANVVDLKLTIVDDQDQVKPFHILESNKKPPLFPHLINFEVSTCCHEATIEDVISLLENCPVLNSLMMSHRDPNICANQDKKKKRDWQSKLPRNSEGNYQNAYFSDLHIGDEKCHVIKLLSRRLTSKKRRIELAI